MADKYCKVCKWYRADMFVDTGGFCEFLYKGAGNGCNQEHFEPSFKRAGLNLLILLDKANVVKPIILDRIEDYINTIEGGLSEKEV